MSAGWMVLMGSGCLVVLALAIYAGQLLYRLRVQQVQQLEQQQRAIAGRKVHITDSVQIIAKAMQRQECDLSEGTIRIVKLLAAIPAEPQDWPALYPELHTFYGKIQHMPILDARRALAKQARMQLDLQRLRYEAEHGERMQQEISQLSTFEC